MTSFGTPPADPLERLGNEVRRFLGDRGQSVRRLVRRTTGQVRAVAGRVSARIRARAARTVAARRYFADPAGAWAGSDALAVSSGSAMGLRGFAAGLLLAGAYALATGGDTRQALGPSLAEFVWALGRFAVIVLLVDSRELPRSRQAAAYVAGLAPYVFAVTPVLRFGALVASALITFAGLTGAGLTGRRARRAVAWAFGGQVGAISVGWVARAGLALLLA